MSTIYLELEHDKNKKYEELDDGTNHEFITNIEREQKKLVKKIQSIAGKEGLDYLESLKEEIERYKKNIENLYVRINDNLHQAYWDSIREELSKDPPNFSVISHLLSETKELLINCNKNIQKELEDNIDINFREDMFNRGVLDNKYINNMCNYIISKIGENQAVSDDKDLEEFRSRVNSELDSSVYYREFFPMYFREVFERLERIVKDMNIINMIRENIEN